MCLYVSVPNRYERWVLSQIPPNLRDVARGDKSCGIWCKYMYNFTICTGFGAQREGVCKKYKLAGRVDETTICDSYED